jgi:AraC-like DNA-binding protein
MDVLTDLLQRSRARGAAFSRTSAHGTWGLTFRSDAALSIHALVEGEAHLWTDDPDSSVRLMPGDVALVRQDIEHHLAGAPGADCVPFASVLEPGAGASNRGTLGSPSDGPPTTFFCGAYMFEGDLCDGLLVALPPSVRVRPASGTTLRATMDLLAHEMLCDQPGQQALLDRLLDVALVQLLREHFNSHHTDAPGWFRASADPRVAAALQALHADPARQWTVADLATEAALSRSAFARRFTEQLGVAPLEYLSDWRMALARERLRDTDRGLAAIAQSLGYASEFSFATAFKRRTGIAPGRWRRDARAAATAVGSFPASGTGMS